MRRTWCVIAYMMLSMLILTGCEEKMTAENYAKITNGMDRSQVEHILGGAGEKQENTGMNISAAGMAGSSTSSRTTYIWKEGRKEISVSFENGKVVSFASAGL